MEGSHGSSFLISPAVVRHSASQILIKFPYGGFALRRIRSTFVEWLPLPHSRDQKAIIFFLESELYLPAPPPFPLPVRFLITCTSSLRVCYSLFPRSVVPVRTAGEFLIGNRQQDSYPPPPAAFTPIAWFAVFDFYLRPQPACLVRE